MLSLRHLRRFRALFVAVVFSLAAALLARGAVVHCASVNEPGHLVAGLAAWELDRFDIFYVNPPLVRTVAVVPVLFAGVKTDWHNLSEGPGARPEFKLGEDLAAANGERFIWLMTLARWACIPFALVGGWICYLWSRRLYGARAGVLSLAL